jgi:hypothetical protein
MPIKKKFRGAIERTKTPNGKRELIERWKDLMNEEC